MTVEVNGRRRRGERSTGDGVNRSWHEGFRENLCRGELFLLEPKSVSLFIGYFGFYEYIKCENQSSVKLIGNNTTEYTFIQNSQS